MKKCLWREGFCVEFDDREEKFVSVFFFCFVQTTANSMRETILAFIVKVDCYGLEWASCRVWWMAKVWNLVGQDAAGMRQTDCVVQTLCHEILLTRLLIHISLIN